MRVRPGIVVSVDIHNETNESVNLDGLVVNADYGKGIPASPIFVPGQRLGGFLAPGQRRSGRYEFRIAKGQADTVVIDIEQSNSPNVVIVEAAALTRVTGRRRRSARCSRTPAISALYRLNEYSAWERA